MDSVIFHIKNKHKLTINSNTISYFIWIFIFGDNPPKINTKDDFYIQIYSYIEKLFSKKKRYKQNYKLVIEIFTYLICYFLYYNNKISTKYESLFSNFNNNESLYEDINSKESSLIIEEV